LALLADHAGAMRFLKRRAGTFATIGWVAFVALTVAFPSFRYSLGSLMFNTFGFTLVAIAGFFTVAYGLTSSHSDFANRLLSWRPLVYIGQISYGMYLFESFVSAITHHLFHIPFEGPEILAMRRFLPLDLAMLLILSSASFYVWENPIREWGIKRFLGSSRAVTRDETDLARAKSIL
jgi:peptidoglycan/LPS O-acetylase OafA/YrhL